MSAETATALSEAPPGSERAPHVEEHVLSVDNLTVEFRLRGGVVVKAVTELSYTLDRGETLAVLGESGSGKTVSAHAILGLLPTPPAIVTDGTVRFGGTDLLSLSASDRRKLCGTRIAMVFQDALAALNPVFTVGYQLAEIFRVHGGYSKKRAWEAAAEQLDRVGIPAASARLHDYPHQFSGGMRQRVMIAMAVALDPDVLIADEPTTALDVTVQAQILDLLGSLKRESGMGLILVTHDLGVVAESADRVVVMYAGRAVESGPVRSVLDRTAHPYTEGLLRAMPTKGGKGELLPIPGAPPRLSALPSGCAFRLRCPYAEALCEQERPQYRPVGAARGSACHFAERLLDA